MGVNWWAIIVAAVIKFVIGGIWYMPLFGKRYRTLMGVAEGSDMSGMGPALGISTANEMHVPINTSVRLSLHTIEPGLPAAKGEEFATGVIHSFWVPKLAGKQDVVPGRVNKLTIRASEPGTYKGQCAEYCNLSHANMRLRVVSQSQGDFDAWTAQQRKPVNDT